MFIVGSNAHLPVAVTMAGGYAPNIEDIVDIHFRTVEAAVLHGEFCKGKIGA